MAEVIEQVKQDLIYNLNHWKRLEGDEHPASLQHFYNVVLSKERLKELSKLQNRVFPPWGTSHEGLIYGGMHQGKWVNIGLRWYRDDKAFVEQHAAHIKNERTSDTKSGRVKTQVCVMMEDVDFFDYIHTKRMDSDPSQYELLERSGGRKGKNKKPHYKMRRTVTQRQEFLRTKIVPLALVMRSLPVSKNDKINAHLTQNVTGGLADNVAIEDNSMFYSHRITDEMFQKAMDQDKQTRDELEQLGRKCVALWGI